MSESTNSDDFVYLPDEVEQLPDLIPIIQNNELPDVVDVDDPPVPDNEKDEPKKDDLKKITNLQLTDLIPQSIKTKVYYGFTVTTLIMIYVVGKLIYKFIMW